MCMCLANKKVKSLVSTAVDMEMRYSTRLLPNGRQGQNSIAEEPALSEPKSERAIDIGNLQDVQVTGPTEPISADPLLEFLG